MDGISVHDMLTRPIMGSELSDCETDVLANLIKLLLTETTEIYFKPLTDKKASGEVSAHAVSNIHRLTAELTSRYLLSGF